MNERTTKIRRITAQRIDYGTTWIARVAVVGMIAACAWLVVLLIASFAHLPS